MKFMIIMWDDADTIANGNFIMSGATYPTSVSQLDTKIQLLWK